MFQGELLMYLLKLAGVWQNTTVGLTILELVYATFIPGWLLLDIMVCLVRVYVFYRLITWTIKKLDGQEYANLFVEKAAKAA